MVHTFLSSKSIYKAKRGHVYDPEKPKYNCFIPARSGSWEILDCWPCDEDGNIHPGYSVSPVPVHRSVLGAVVGEVEA
jgi:hypothetical protein